MPAKRRPSYFFHKPTGQARARIDGKDHYLGAYDSAESRERYEALVARWLLRNGDAKYRRKLATALVHAWGRRTASIVRAVLAKPADDRTDKERQIVQRNLHRFADGVDGHRAEQCVRFILGDEDGLTLRRLAAYRDAKRDLATGPGLPVSKPEAIGLGLLKVLFEADVDRGAVALLGMVRPAIEGNRDARRIEEVKHGIS